MSFQDNFYKKIESDSFFKRNFSKLDIKDIRENKKKNYNFISNRISFDNKKVLEVGCFIGDLLHYIKRKNNCKVKGIEPSKLACKYALQKYKIKLENKTLVNSEFSKFRKKDHKLFDLIICDDVLSWIDRDVILRSLSILDWVLKDNGYIFIRDFSPSESIMVKNHHWKKEKIFNFKHKEGHKKIFLNSGKYILIKRNLFITDKFQKKESTNLETKKWEDVLIKKIKQYTFKEVKL